MTKNKIIDLFDYENYSEVYDLTNPYKKDIILDYEILYFLKSKLALDKFKIKDKKEIKKLFFYYFYLVGKVEFDNNYYFSFNNSIKISFKEFEKEILKLNDFKNYFYLGKNEIFLNKIVDTTILKDGLNYREGAFEVNNIIDFFIVFTYECSELYAFSGNELPLFKWLINELID